MTALIFDRDGSQGDIRGSKRGALLYGRVTGVDLERRELIISPKPSHIQFMTSSDLRVLLTREQVTIIFQVMDSRWEAAAGKETGDSLKELRRRSIAGMLATLFKDVLGKFQGAMSYHT